jgi:signal peptidase
MINILYKTVYAAFIIVLLAIAGLFLSTMLPIPGQTEIKIVKSGSMEPAIATGSVVVVRPADSYAAGDVITFGRDTRDEIPTTHRVIEVQGSGQNTVFITQGDANEERDPRPIALSEVIGKVFITIPYAGFVLDFARQPIGFTLLIGIPAALIIFDELLRIVQEVGKLRRRRRDEDEITHAFSDSPTTSPTSTQMHKPRHFDIPLP